MFLAADDECVVVLQTLLSRRPDEGSSFSRAVSARWGTKTTSVAGCCSPPPAAHVARWSSSMILALGVRGSGFLDEP